MPPALRPNELLELLLHDGVSLNVRGDDVRKWTILHHLCYVGDVDGLRTALEHVSIDTMNQKDSDGDTAFAIAFKRLYKEKKDDDFEKTDVTRDLKGNIASGLCELLMKGANKEETDGRGDTLIRLAMEAGRSDLASKLIANGFDFETRSPKDGNSAFHVAVKMDSSILVKDMLTCNRLKDVNAVDGKGDAALIHAVMNENLDICTQLLDAKADPNVLSSEGHSCIAIALELQNEDVACLLTKYVKA